MAWIEPLELETWLINVFSGDQAIFLAVALLVIFTLAGMFKMRAMVMFFMLGMFFIIFNEYIGNFYYFMLVSIGGLFLMYWIKKIIT